MVTGFVAVPLFKFIDMGEAMTALGELPPSFLLSAAVGITISLVAGPGAQTARAS